MIINFFTLNFAATSCYINDSNSDTNLLDKIYLKLKKKKKEKKKEEEEEPNTNKPV
jgi:hypothetical protein